MIQPFVAARPVSTIAFKGTQPSAHTPAEPSELPFHHPTQSKPTATNGQFSQFSKAIKHALEKLADFITPTSREALQKAVKTQANTLHKGGHSQQQLMIQMAELIEESPNTPATDNPKVTHLNQQSIQQLKAQALHLKKIIQLRILTLLM